jgi:hypothetical protein
MDMRNFIIFVIAIIAVCVYCSGVKAELLKNPGFENGTWTGEGDMPWDWWKYGKGGWASWKSVANGSGYLAHSGDKLYGVGAWTPGDYYYCGQSVPVNAGEIITFTIWGMTENWGTPVGGLMIEWKDSEDVTLGTELNYDITGGSISSVWTKYSISGVTVPAGAVTANVQIFGESQGSMLFDDASVFFTYAANDEQPADGVFANPTTTTQLSWTRPQPRNGTGTIYCDVWFGTDPAMTGTNTKILSHTAANSVAVSLALNQTYYWRVDCYDSSTSPETMTTGRVWSFNTGNSAPVVDAGKKQAVWLSGGTASVALSATVSDDGLPNPPASMTYSWTVVSGTGSVVFSPSAIVTNPAATFTTAGDYVLKFTANDGQKDSNDTVKIRVYASTYTGLIAQWKLDETSGTTAVDTVGSHNGTLMNGPVWQASGGYVGGSILLDGVNDYINCGGGVIDHNIPSWADLKNEITIAAWIKVDVFDGNKPWQGIVTKGDTAWRLARAGNENVINFACNGLSPSFDVQGSTDVTDGKWHQIVGTYDGAELALYVDGILDIYSGSPSQAAGSIGLDSNDVYIGSNSAKQNREFGGMIDNVRIYEIGLPAEKVVDLFRADGGKNSCVSLMAGDVNGDCYVDFVDLADMALNWLKCNDVGNSRCW